MSVDGAAKLPACGVRSYGPEAVSHSHDHHQLILPLDGTLHLETDVAGGCVDGAQAAAIACGMRHSYSAGGPNRFAVIDWPVDDAPSMALWERLRRQPYFALPAALYPALHWFGLHGDAQSPAWRRQWAGLVVLTLADVLDAGARDAQPARLAAAMRHACDHLGEPIGPRELAAAAGISRGRLHALFRSRLGTTPMAWVREQRLHAAARLLADCGFAIAEVAQRVGFSDQSALTRHFHARFGMTPARYRRARRH